MGALSASSEGQSVTETMPEAFLEMIEGPDMLENGRLIGRRIRLTQPRTLIGRNEHAAVQIYDPAEPSTVSRRHCTIEYDTERKCFVLTDEHSSYGTYVSDIKAKPQEPLELHDGDTIELGIAKSQGALLRFLCASMKTRPASKDRRVLPRRLKRTGSLKEDEAADAVTEPGEAEPAPAAPPEDQIETTQPQAAVEAMVKPIPPMQAQVTANLGAPAYVVLTYSREDTLLVSSIRGYLLRNDIEAWADDQIVPGSDVWRETTLKKIEEARCVVVIMTRRTQHSIWIEKEIEHARAHNVRIFSVLASGSEKKAVPVVLQNEAYIDIRNAGYDSGMDTLINQIRTHLVFDLYIVHSAADIDLMRLIRDHMQATASIWVDEQTSHDADDWKRKIDRARCVVALLTPDANRSERVHAELAYVLEKGKKIIPVLGEGDESTSSMGQKGTGYTTIDMTPANRADGLQKLASRIQKELKGNNKP